MQAIHSEGRVLIPVSVACFNYSIAGVNCQHLFNYHLLSKLWYCRRCERHTADYYCSFNMLPMVRITRGGLKYFSQIIRSKLVVVPRGKKTCVRRTRLWELLGIWTMIYASRDAGFCVPENPVFKNLGIDTQLI